MVAVLTFVWVAREPLLVPVALRGTRAVFAAMTPSERVDAALHAASLTFGRELRAGQGPRCTSTYAASASNANIQHLESRYNLPQWLETLQFKGDGAELGVQRGEFAAHSLRVWPSGAHYYMVDPWAQQAVYVDLANVATSEQENRMAEAAQAVAAFPTRAVLMRNFSFDAAKAFEDCALDYVYVDAVHDYAGALNDMIDWWPKVRPGGVMGGHDFADGIFRDGIFGVESAVRHFSAAVNVPFYLTGEKSTFYMIKPRSNGN